MAEWKTCDICGIPSGPKNPVLRFGLRRMEIKKVDGKWTSRAHASGSLDICNDCWIRHAKPRMQPQKGRKKGPWPPRLLPEEEAG